MNDAVAADKYHRLKTRAAALGMTLEDLVREAEQRHSNTIVDRPRVVRLPIKVKEILDIGNGRAFRIHFHSISDTQRSSRDMDTPIEVKWYITHGIYVTSHVENMGPYPEDPSSLWLEFDEDAELIAAGYWKVTNTTVIWE